MSNVYATEPAPSGRVLLETTHGPLEIQLWCRECPTVTKLFMQLCLDNFYRDMIFHRIVPDFLIQTGALRVGNKATGFTKEYRNKVNSALSLERRKFETHSRLRFNHRGQLAMALGVHDSDDEELQPQFFITLDEAPYLDGKHVLFGTCSGPTIFNALRIGKLSVDKNYLPTDLEHAPRVTECRVIENPIHNTLASSPVVPWFNVEPRSIEKRTKKRKGKNDLKLLSFGDEMEDEQVTGMSSFHDMAKSKSFSNIVDDKVKKRAMGNLGEIRKPISHDENVNDKTNMDAIDEVSEGKMLDQKSPCISSKNESKDKSAQNEAKPIKSSKFNDETKVQLQDKIETKSKISLVESRRAHFKGKISSNSKDRVNDVMVKLAAFKSKVKSQTYEREKNVGMSGIVDKSVSSRSVCKTDEPGKRSSKPDSDFYHGQIMDAGNNDDQMKDWIGTQFKCRQHVDLISRLGGDIKGGDGRDIHDYEIIDEKRVRKEKWKK